MQKNHYNINIVTDDNYLKHGLIEYFSLHSDVHLQMSTDPLPERVTDMYLVPAENTAGLLGESSGRPRTWLPVFCYGPAYLLGRSFVRGCTDYLTDPWQPEELYYRALYSRHSRFQCFSWKEISFTPFQAASGEERVELSKQEYLVFHILRSSPGQAVSRRAISYALWDRERPGSRAVDMHVSSLRRKIGGLVKDEVIYTVHGEGYLLRPDF